MRKVFGLVALVALSASFACADANSPSTAADRSRALTVIQKLEASPMDPALKQDREWVFQWVKAVPDVDAHVCSAIIKPLQDQKNSPERNALMLQNILATAAFSMEHPDKAKDKVATYLAGTEGMLRAYANLVKQNPSKKNPFMESLREKQQQGTLLAYVKKGADECSKHPATILQP